MTGTHSSCVQCDTFLATSPSPFFIDLYLKSQENVSRKRLLLALWCSEAATHIVSWRPGATKRGSPAAEDLPERCLNPPPPPCLCLYQCLSRWHPLFVKRPLILFIKPAVVWIPLQIKADQSLVNVYVIQSPSRLNLCNSRTFLSAVIFFFFFFSGAVASNK